MLLSLYNALTLPPPTLETLCLVFPVFSFQILCYADITRASRQRKEQIRIYFPSNNTRFVKLLLCLVISSRSLPRSINTLVTQNSKYFRQFELKIQRLTPDFPEDKAKFEVGGYIKYIIISNFYCFLLYVVVYKRKTWLFVL